MMRIFSFLEAGNFWFSVPLTVGFVFILSRIILKIIQKKQLIKKNRSFIYHFGLIGLLYGMLGQIIGLHKVFNYTHKLDEISEFLLLNALYVTSIPTILGLLIFMLSRYYLFITK